MTDFSFLSGLRNCHLHGLHSFVIANRTSPAFGMTRVYYAEDRMLLWDRDHGDFNVKPHNHRQKIRMIKIFGDVTNWEFANIPPNGDQSRGLKVYRYRFGSALLNGKFELGAPTDYVLEYTPRKLQADEPILLPSVYTHTVTAAPGSAWMIQEYEEAPKDQGLYCFSTTPKLELNSAGLYIPMTAREVVRYEELISHDFRRVI